MSNTPDTKRIYNPDSEDFTTTYDLDGTGQPIAYTIHSLDTAEFPIPIADHLAIHLARRLVDKRGFKGSNYIAQLQKALQEVNYELF